MVENKLKRKTASTRPVVANDETRMIQDDLMQFKLDVEHVTIGAKTSKTRAEREMFPRAFTPRFFAGSTPTSRRFLLSSPSPSRASSPKPSRYSSPATSRSSTPRGSPRRPVGDSAWRSASTPMPRPPSARGSFALSSSPLARTSSRSSELTPRGAANESISAPMLRPPSKSASRATGASGGRRRSLIPDEDEPELEA